MEEKRLTIDLPEESYKELLKIQFDKKMNGDKDSSLRQMLRNVVLNWIEKQSMKPINQ